MEEVVIGQFGSEETAGNIPSGVTQWSHTGVWRMDCARVPCLQLGEAALPPEACYTKRV